MYRPLTAYELEALIKGSRVFQPGEVREIPYSDDGVWIDPVGARTLDEWWDILIREDVPYWTHWLDESGEYREGRPDPYE